MARIFPSWSDLAKASRSRLFKGTPADVAADRARSPLPHVNDEALFTQSNARVLLGHAANGLLRFVALPTQVYPAPTGTGEFGLGPGMYHHFDVAMYVGDLAYRLELEGQEAPVVVSAVDDPASGLACETVYAADWLPLTTAQAGDLRITLASFAPVAPEAGALAPAPLPGPAGALYVLYVENTGETPVRGKVILHASDLLLGHYEDAQPDRRAMQAPDVSLRQHTLILSRPDGAVGIHLHDGAWRKLDGPCFEAAISFELAPGQARAFETHVALGASYAAVMPTIYALHLHEALDWLNFTAAFWDDRLGTLSIGGAAMTGDEASWVRDTYVRSLLDNFNCLQTDAAGTLIAHWQGAPSHGYGTVWGIDVEPTAVSIAHICPELTWATLCFFMSRSHAPKGPLDHSVPILVAPIIIARQWLQVTGNITCLRLSPHVFAAINVIVDELFDLQSPEGSLPPNKILFPSRYSSDGAVGRRYDYGTNVKVGYAFDSLVYLASAPGGDRESEMAYAWVADSIRTAIRHTMIADGPFGPQITGGTNLGEDPGTFYLPEDGPASAGGFYYDGEDTSSMLAPLYGMADLTDETWVNHHRWARSTGCPNFDPEFGALRWSPGSFGAGALDGTGFFSRLGGSVTPAEMREAVHVAWHTGTDDVTGSLFWWPHGLEYKRSLTRCSQGQGAWAWQMLEQWLGLEVDALAYTLTLAPRGLPTAYRWDGFRAGPHRFDIAWDEDATTAEVTNRNPEPWTVKIGFRRPSSGAAAPLAWQTHTLAPGATLSLDHAWPELTPAVTQDYDEPAMVRLEVERGGDEGILVRRYGPAHLWGHWEADKLWDPRSMPLTLRFLIENGTATDWEHVAVTLTCPEGWGAVGRQPRHWTQPTDPRRVADLALDSVPARCRTVAPFWVQWPEDLALHLRWDAGNEVPFHSVAQPDPGVTLYAEGLAAPIELAFEAEVRMTPTAGDLIVRRVTVPVTVLPR